MTNKLIDEIRNNLDNGNVTSEMLFEEATSKAKKYQDEYNSFVTIMDNKEELEGNSILRGIPYALKDNISTKGILTTASSNILKDYIPLYDATIYKKLKESGAVLMGKTVLDELAMGGTGTTGHTGIVRNPWNKERMIGGSSAGSAAAVALGIVPFAIGSDTGDSIRKPAAYGGVVGYKPTYGRISRYGLFAFASSLDHLGVFARSVKDVSYVMDIVKGHDEKDMTSLPDEDISYVDNIDNDIKGKKLFYISDGAFFASGLRSVELAKNISNVGLYAFAYNTKLQKVTLGDKVEQINTPFIGCTNLKQFQADKKETGYYAVDGVLYYKDKEKTYMKCYPAAKQEDSYEFPAGVNGGGLCFANCRYLKKVVYAKDSIMGQDFYECHNLTVVLPDVVVNPATGSESDSYDGKWEPFKNCTNFILQGKKNPFMQSYAVSKGFTYSIV